MFSFLYLSFRFSARQRKRKDFENFIKQRTSVTSTLLNSNSNPFFSLLSLSLSLSPPSPKNGSLFFVGLLQPSVARKSSASRKEQQKNQAPFFWVSEMAIHQQGQSSSLLLDALYCEEPRWGEEGWSDEDEAGEVFEGESFGSRFPPLLEQDLFWEDSELQALFSKEKEQQKQSGCFLGDSEASLAAARSDAVDWVLRVVSHHGFATPTGILAINYLDRFLNSFQFQRDKPWMAQLMAVTCLSLAAKVEEIQVPLLLDLQVGETKYLFEAKTIQRMELLVLSALQWRMHPVTPLSFLDHITRRLGLKTNLHWEFLRRCENLILSVSADSKSVGYLPSELATATMMHVIDQVEPFNSMDYQNQLLSLLKINQERVSECYKLIVEVAWTQVNTGQHKRKYYDQTAPSSPSGVIDAVFSRDSSVSSSPEPAFKKSRAQEQEMRLPLFVDIVGSPP